MLKTTIPWRTLAHLQCRWATQSSQQPFPPDINEWSHPPSSASISDDEIYRLAAKPRRPLTLADLVKYVLTIPRDIPSLTMTGMANLPYETLLSSPLPTLHCRSYQLD